MYYWISAWPGALSGDPAPASAEKGKVFFESCVNKLVHILEKIKADTTQEAFKKFYETARLHARTNAAKG